MAFRHRPMAKPNSIRLFTLHPGKFNDDLVGVTSYWIDAICINIDNICERSAQTCLMPAIVAGAGAVIAWLGPDEPRLYQSLESDNDKWNRMRINWNNGKIKFLPAIMHWVDGLGVKTTPRHCVQTMALERNDYWNRLWVLHELCNAKRVFFVCGKNVWREEDLDSYTQFFGGRPFASTLNERRYKDRRLPLESLLIKYHSYESREPLDRVYALIGLSSDTIATAPGLDVDTANSNSNVPETGTPLTRLTIGYRKPHYETWKDLVRCKVGTVTDMTHVGEAEDGPRIDIVRFAGIIQKALGRLDYEGHLEKREASPYLTRFSDNCIIAKGYFAGYIHLVGPSYKEIALAHDQQAPPDNFPIYDEKQEDAKFRAFVQKYTAQLITSRRLERTTSSNSDDGLSFLDQHRGWVWGEGVENDDFKFTQACCMAAKAQKLPSIQTGDFVRFIGTDHSVGFASSAAGIKEGDRIVAFQGCHVGFIVRSLASSSSYLRIVSQVHVETAHRTVRLMNHYGGDYRFPGWSPMEDNDYEKAYVMMDFRTLQQLTTGMQF
ncbi:hypothetical protein CTA2_811 [Colletotrichum tanaceti]|uniref:Heterokaryon incompatibility domain-containing protein n=1 Tax=Colletotrichum tanaceti TaxID=1306861 RepID=A0A4U6XB08_9PEZI|nr:hypothetical protein CTA2_811 [Colletotrichum tanaceti]TKW52299.1 hypothetical protein CTA1_3098 [Colletotrichum tanaceti]